jgi:hypothetical protein
VLLRHHIALLNRAGWVLGMLAAVLYAGEAISRGVFLACAIAAAILFLVAWRIGKTKASG